MMVVALVLARITSGMMEASTTIRLSMACITHSGVTTAMGSEVGPILQVPDEWCCVRTFSRSQRFRASSSDSTSSVGSRRVILSDDANVVMRELQDMRILARATHMEIEGGSFSLYGNEIAEVERAPWLPNSVENRIARDAERTERIIRAYKS